MLVYATAPVSAIVAILEVGQVIHDSPLSVWEQYASVGAITEQEFWDYYGDRELALAVEIADVHQLPTAITLCTILPGGRPPQSFQYVQASVIADVLDSIGLLDSLMLAARDDEVEDTQTVCEVFGPNT
jgi:predicted transcriptional regulator